MRKHFVSAPRFLPPPFRRKAGNLERIGMETFLQSTCFHGKQQQKAREGKLRGICYQ